MLLGWVSYIPRQLQLPFTVKGNSDLLCLQCPLPKCHNYRCMPPWPAQKTFYVLSIGYRLFNCFFLPSEASPSTYSEWKSNTALSSHCVSVSSLSAERVCLCLNLKVMYTYECVPWQASQGRCAFVSPSRNRRLLEFLPYSECHSLCYNYPQNMERAPSKPLPLNDFCPSNSYWEPSCSWVGPVEIGANVFTLTHWFSRLQQFFKLMEKQW